MPKISNNIVKILQKHGLKPASQRQLPLFSSSCIAYGYTKLLKKLLGFSYGAVGFIGIKTNTYYLLNETHIAQQTEKFIQKNFQKFEEKMFKPAKKITEQTKKFIQKIKTQEPKDCLKNFVKFYPTYFSGISIYNCFWRYLGNEATKGKLSKKLITRIKKEREAIAKLYPQTEEILKSSVKKMDNNDLLRYLSYFEMKSYLENKKIPSQQELKKRQQKYFYLYQEKENQEYITTNKNTINKIYNTFYKIDTSQITSIKGKTVYPGIARAKVLNLTQTKYKNQTNFILVTSMTHPKDILLIKKSKAIVTDEGGLLSHAAIISRELRIPCLIATKIATQVLKDGVRVKVDANKGIVKIIK